MMVVRWPDGILLMVTMMAVILTIDIQCDNRISPSHNMRILKADDWLKMMGPPCNKKN